MINRQMEQDAKKKPAKEKPPAKEKLKPSAVK